MVSTQNPVTNPFVLVTWHDAISYGGWRDSSSLPPSSGCVSAGWLLSKDPDVVIAQSTSQDGELWGQLFAIPKDCVTEIKEIQELKEIEWQQ